MVPLQAPDESLQASAATTLQSLVASEVGCRDMLQHGGLPQLLQLLKQPSAAVKDAVYGALCAAAHFEALRTALMQEQGAMRQLLGHVQQEEAGRAAQALELLVHCTQVRQLPGGQPCKSELTDCCGLTCVMYSYPPSVITSR